MKKSSKRIVARTAHSIIFRISLWINRNSGYDLLGIFSHTLTWFRIRSNLSLMIAPTLARLIKRIILIWFMLRSIFICPLKAPNIVPPYFILPFLSLRISGLFKIAISFMWFLFLNLLLLFSLSIIFNRVLFVGNFIILSVNRLTVIRGKCWLVLKLMVFRWMANWLILNGKV